jgi:very-short-patch-repair endonuclease
MIWRQHPISRLIADSQSMEATRIIEIDGDAHAEPDHAALYAERTAWLEQRGYRVLGFQARELDKDLRAVLQAICEACEARRS